MSDPALPTDPAAPSPQKEGAAEPARLVQMLVAALIAGIVLARIVRRIRGV